MGAGLARDAGTSVCPVRPRRCHPVINARAHALRGHASRDAPRHHLHRQLDAERPERHSHAERGNDLHTFSSAGSSCGSRACPRCRHLGLSVRPRRCHRRQASSHRVSVSPLNVWWINTANAPAPTTTARSPSDSAPAPTDTLAPEPPARPQPTAADDADEQVRQYNRTTQPPSTWRPAWP